MSVVQSAPNTQDAIQELRLAAGYRRIVREAAEDRLRKAVSDAVAAGLSQRQIGVALGCSQPEVHRILRRAATTAVQPSSGGARPRRRSRGGFVPSSSLGNLLVDRRNAILEIAARHHASNLRVFGSVARGEDGDGSDIDLLADFDGTNPLDQIAMAREIEVLLGVSVDLGSADALRPRLREDVLREAVSL